MTQEESHKTFYESLEINANLEYSESPFADFIVENDSENYNHYEIYELSPSFRDLNDLSQLVVKVILIKECT